MSGDDVLDYGDLSYLVFLGEDAETFGGLAGATLLVTEQMPIGPRFELSELSDKFTSCTYDVEKMVEFAVLHGGWDRFRI